MARKSIVFTVEADNRDKGKQFKITEMPARKAEEWAIRLACAVIGAGVTVPDNMMMAINMLGVCEGFALAEKLGISHQTLFDVVSTSTGNSFALSNYCPIPDIVPTTPASRNYTRGFNTSLLVKDLTLAQSAAQDAGVATPMGAHALASFRHFMAIANSAGRDFSSVVDYVRAKLK